MLAVSIDGCCDLLTEDIVECISLLKNITCDDYFKRSILIKKSLNINDENTIRTIDPMFRNVSSSLLFLTYKKFCINKLNTLGLPQRFKNLLTTENQLFKKIIFAEPEWRKLDIKKRYLTKSRYQNEIKKSQKMYEKRSLLSGGFDHTKLLFQYLYASFYKTAVFKENYSSGVDVREDYLTKTRLLMKVCPYCGLELIKKKGCEIEHFVPLSKNPLYGLSSYNLTVCCHDCNSVYKNATFELPQISPVFDEIWKHIKFNLEYDTEEFTITSRDRRYNQAVSNYEQMIGLKERLNSDYKEEIIERFYFLYKDKIRNLTEENVNTMMDKLSVDKSCYNNVIRDLFQEFNHENEEELLRLYVKYY